MTTPIEDVLPKETTAVPFDVIKFFENSIERKAKTLNGIDHPTKIEDIVKVTSWYHTNVVSRNLTGKLWLSLGPVGLYDGVTYEIKTRKAPNTESVLAEFDTVLAQGKTLIVYEFNSMKAIDPETFEPVASTMIRYAEI